MVSGKSSGQRRSSRLSSEAPKESEPDASRPPEEPPNQGGCTYCGAPCPGSQQDANQELVGVNVDNHVCYFQAAAKRSAEMSDQMVAKLNETKSSISAQRTQVAEMKKEIESEHLQLKEDEASLKERKKKLTGEREDLSRELTEREKKLLQREQSLEEKVSDLRAKEAAVADLENILNSRYISFTEREASLTWELSRREEELAARENHANSILKAAEDKKMSIVGLQEKLAEKEATFKDLELATIEELDGREAVLERRESTVARRTGELQMQRKEIDMLRQEIQKREEQFVQWERLSKYDLSKCQDSLVEKEQTLSIQKDKVSLKELELKNHISDFERRENDFKLSETKQLQDVERREAAATDHAKLLKERETVLSAREKEVQSLSKDIETRDASFQSEYSIWKAEIERREKLVVEKEEGLMEMTSSTSQKQSAIHAAEKDIEKRRMVLMNAEQESKMKSDSEKIRADEAKLKLSKIEEILAERKGKLEKWENDLSKREADNSEKHAKADNELHRREKEALNLEAKWTAIQKDYALKMEDLSHREAELIKREEMFLDRINNQQRDSSRRLHEVKGREARVADLEQELTQRETTLLEGKEKLLKKKEKLDAFEHRITLDSERREADVSGRELRARNLDVNLCKKEEDIKALQKNLMTRMDADDMKFDAEAKDFTRRKNEMDALDSDITVRLRRVTEQEESISADQLKVKERLTYIESQESRLSNLMDREKQLAEHERLVEMRDREMKHRNKQLQELEASLKKLEAASETRIKELDDREMRLVDEEKLLSHNIDMHVVDATAFEEEVRQKKTEISKREKYVSAKNEEVGNKETWLASQSSKVEENMERLRSLDVQLQNFETVLNEKESNLKESKSDLVSREERHLQRQSILSAELDKREKAVATSEAIVSRKGLDIQTAETKIREEMEFISQSNSEIQILRQQIHSKDRRIYELEEQIRQIEADLGKYCNMNSQAISFLQQRKLSGGVIGSEPRSEAGDDLMLMKNIEHSSRVCSTHNAHFTSRLDEATMLTATDQRKQQPETEEEGGEDGGGWYGHVRNILFRWKSTSSTDGKPQREIQRPEARPILDTGYNRMTTYSHVPRLEQDGIYQVGRSRKRSPPALSSEGKDASPENAPRDKLMRVESP